jgi:multidrug transporter EmrE-like cation transporter
MNLHTWFWVLLAGAVVLEAAGDVLFKMAHIESRTTFLVLGTILYLIAVVVWAFSLKYEMLSKAIALFSVLNAMAVIAAGFVLFGEQPSLLAKVGMVLGVVAVGLLQL